MKKHPPLAISLPGTLSNINLHDVLDNKQQDTIMHTQPTIKESQQEDMPSLASKFQLNKNLIDIDFKKNEKDLSQGQSVVDKDKGTTTNYGIMSDTSLQQATGHRNALKKLISKKLRYCEKMKNVEQWRLNQLEFLQKNTDQLEDPTSEQYNKNTELDAEKIEMIEMEFLEHQKLVE